MSLEGWKYQHVERLGHEDVEGILDGEVCIQEKLDGTNLSVWWENGGPVIASRNRILYEGGRLIDSHRGAVEHVLRLDGLLAYVAAAPRIVRGEWLVKNAVKYSAEAHNKLYVFDIQDAATHAYFPQHAIAQAAWNFRFLMAPCFGSLNEPTVDELLPLTHGPSLVGGDVREGIVLKRYDDWTNKFGRKTWAKITNPLYDSLARKPKRTETPAEHALEARFANEQSDFDIVKVIIEVIAAKGGVYTGKEIQEILGRTWRTHFDENLWTFAKKAQTPFDFRAARRLHEARVKEVLSTWLNSRT